MDPTRVIGLIERLRQMPHESECLEFKYDNFNREGIGEYISALSNTAALFGESAGYIIWGVEDGTHAIVGTKFSPFKARKGNELIETWLLQLLRPRIEFRFYEVEISSKRVVLMEISPASEQPVSFKGKEYIRVGSSKRELKNFPAKERELWRAFDRSAFEDGIAVDNVKEHDIFSLLDVASYFNMMNLPYPDNSKPQLDKMESERIIKRDNNGRYIITNMGAILFATNIKEFDRLSRKTMRVIQYDGDGRISNITREIEFSKGYAIGFEEIVEHINRIVPSNEIIGPVFREKIPMFPAEAIRELVANALIHQDFSVHGSCPMVEIFSHRLEITNPGKPLIDPERFIDETPRSRNETLASLMRRLGFCEERGSGIDKVISAIEMYQLPPPRFEERKDSTKAVLFAYKKLKDMDKSERMRAVYQHACLRYVLNNHVTNTSLRKRLGVDDKNRDLVSRIIRDAMNKKLIVPFNPDSSPRYMKYVPYWAQEHNVHH